MSSQLYNVDGNRIVSVGTSTKLFIILYIIRVLRVLRLLSKVGYPSILVISDTLAYLSNMFKNPLEKQPGYAPASALTYLL